MKRTLLALFAAVLFLNTLVIPTVAHAMVRLAAATVPGRLPAARRFAIAVLQKADRSHPGVVSGGRLSYIAKLQSCCSRTHFCGITCRSRLLSSFRSSLS